MTLTEALKSVQFVTNRQGERTAALLDIHAWKILIRRIEDITDTRISLEKIRELEAAGGRPENAGWLAWENIREEWDEKESEKEGAAI